MSHASSRKKVLDQTLPLPHRASHARSCLNHVANRLGTNREALLERVEKETGINLVAPSDEKALLTAFLYFESL
ncbi:MAG: hypothetical protein E6560_13035 [Yersiniaceae bacterium]|uniref:Uncharacterized protein n=1 Tax=Chimaeribacter coloradensis TaxID=2060068 RepID=A0A2N5EAQ0_9GAMM|nr:hypothetical protein [Chimaeribacter coloradensis]MDU6411869.1 hypothetical protein [Yersiniaceae bacterium]PLR39174.1 hypothetical protein CYR32_02805 [Chimaeribacter coloradensis]